MHIPFDLLTAWFPSSTCDRLIFFGECFRDDRPGMLPFIDNLIQNSGIRVLSGEAKPKKFQTHPRDFIDQHRDICKPPAAKDMQVPEFSSEHTQLMLIFTRKDCAKEFVRWMCGQHI